MRTELRDAVTAEQRHDPVHFALEDLERLPRAGLAAGGDTVEHGAAEQHEVGAERQGLDDVGAAAEAAVDEHAQPLAHRRDDRRQRLERGERAVELPPAMVGDDDAVGAVARRELCILDREDAFHQQLARPRVAQPGEIGPVGAIAA